ncbi:MAG: flagellar biosynthesis protein FliQ [Defluviitaleaceae bacterium]|nr:flagellar biosynthesis protein FliQ [Defluviitaleaceae bacterium]
MTEQRVIDMVASGLFTIILSAAPPLLMGLAVGLIVAIFQTVTSIQEQTLAFVPKIVAVLVALVIFGPFIIGNITQYFREIVISLPELIVPF